VGAPKVEGVAPRDASLEKSRYDKKQQREAKLEIARLEEEKEEEQERQRSQQRLGQAQKVLERRTLQHQSPSKKEPGEP
jgi:hypothetical protein